MTCSQTLLAQQIFLKDFANGHDQMLNIAIRIYLPRCDVFPYCDSMLRFSVSIDAFQEYSLVRLPISPVMETSYVAERNKFYFHILISMT